jgi:hypothetical protein
MHLSCPPGFDSQNPINRQQISSTDGEPTGPQRRTDWINFSLKLEAPIDWSGKDSGAHRIMTNCETVRNRTQVAVKQELTAIKPGKDVIIGELATIWRPPKVAMMILREGPNRFNPRHYSAVLRRDLRSKEQLTATRHSLLQPE